MHYNFIHQVDKNNNRQHLPISVERKWATNFLEDRNCAWYLATSLVNTNFAWVHFRQDGKVDATLDFRRKLAHECLVNSIWVGKDNEYVGSRPLRTCRMNKKGTCRLATAPKYLGAWISKQTKWSKVKQKYKNKGVWINQVAKIGCAIFLYATGEFFCLMNALWNTKLV